MFVRTSDGLANERLFYDVDYVVYCEGKAVDGEASSLDEVFWNKLFSSAGVRVHCKSSGGKSVVRPLAEKIVFESIPNIIVAMDRDYDDFLGNLIDHPRVVYTYGYSWESDALISFEARLVLSLFATSTRSAAIVSEFMKFFEKQSRLLVRPFALDLKYISHASGLFNRQKPMSVVRFQETGEPEINVRRMLDGAKSIKGFQSAQLDPETFREPCGARRFYGKAVARLVYHWFVARTKRMQGSRKVQYESFMSLVAEIFSLDDVGIPRNSYYQNVIDRL